jgi:hypothetical protein
MQISLRLLIGSLLALLVLAVALAAFFLVFDVSIASVRRLARTHAEQVALKTAQTVSARLAEPVDVLVNWQNATIAGTYTKYYTPEEDPDGYRAGCLKWMASVADVIVASRGSFDRLPIRFFSWTTVHVSLVNGTIIEGTCARSNASSYFANGQVEVYSDVITLRRDLSTGAISHPVIGVDPFLTPPNPGYHL